MKAYGTVILDFDGTLLKSDAGIADSLQKALRHFGIEETDRAKMQTFIGPPMHVSFPREYGFDAEQTKKAIEIYRGYYNDTGKYIGELYPGVRQLLMNLRNKGKFLILATAKAEMYLEDILEHFGLGGMLDALVGSNKEGTRAHKSEIFQYALETYHIDKNDVVVVGDSRFDINAAHELGLPCIAVTWGYGSGEEIAEAGPDARADTMEQLEALLV